MGKWGTIWTWFFFLLLHSHLTHYVQPCPTLGQHYEKRAQLMLLSFESNNERGPVVRRKFCMQKLSPAYTPGWQFFSRGGKSACKVRYENDSMSELAHAFKKRVLSATVNCSLYDSEHIMHVETESGLPTLQVKGSAAFDSIKCMKMAHRSCVHAMLTTQRTVETTPSASLPACSCLALSAQRLFGSGKSNTSSKNHDAQRWRTRDDNLPCNFDC